MLRLLEPRRRRLRQVSGPGAPRDRRRFREIRGILAISGDIRMMLLSGSRIVVRFRVRGCCRRAPLDRRMPGKGCMSCIAIVPGFQGVTILFVLQGRLRVLQITEIIRTVPTPGGGGPRSPAAEVVVSRGIISGDLRAGIRVVESLRVNSDSLRFSLLLGQFSHGLRFLGHFYRLLGASVVCGFHFLFSLHQSLLFFPSERFVPRNLGVSIHGLQFILIIRTTKRVSPVSYPPFALIILLGLGGYPRARYGRPPQ
mmetsp:Transcript_31393/g.58545  ORF Transcript_31393/g.58545 Transcript_31393/m.58545 type:complete len:255 (+) Transcript_31393:441-1205(+)